MLSELLLFQSIALSKWAFLPLQADQRLGRNCTQASEGESYFYRDPVLRKIWKVSKDSKHPDRPAQSQEEVISTTHYAALSSCDASAVKAEVVVKSGDKVLLLAHREKGTMRLLAEALTSGALGDIIRCRLELNSSVVLARIQKDHLAELVPNIHSEGTW